MSFSGRMDFGFRVGSFNDYNLDFDRGLNVVRNEGKIENDSLLQRRACCIDVSDNCFR